MNNKNKFWLPLLFSVTLVGGMFIGYKVSKDIPNYKNLIIPDSRNVLNEFNYLINNRYVDKISEDSLVNDIISNSLNLLDPHSVLITKDYVQEVNEEIKGRFGGIGIEFNIFNDTPTILKVKTGSPAQKGGLIMGDRIVKVDLNSAIWSKNNPVDIKKMIKGNIDSEVKIQVVRDRKILDFKIVRSEIPIRSVFHAILDNKIGYIKIDKFIEETVRDFISSLQQLKKAGITSLILDLRDNGGGLLEAAVEIADEFLSDDKIIVYTEGKHNPRKNFLCKRNGLYETGGLVVLINKNSASASEVLTGALQDWDRAIVIGSNSFGKGLVQEQFELSNGSAIRLTVAKYYTPSGRCIQKHYKKNISGVVEYNKPDSNNINTDTFRTSNGKIVFGGSGIKPDIIIDKEKNIKNSELLKLIKSNLIFYYAINFREKNINKLIQYKNSQELINNFEFDTKDLRLFTKFLKHNNYNLEFGAALKILPEIKKRLLVNLVNLIWDVEDVIKSTYIYDIYIGEALNFLKNLDN